MNRFVDGQEAELDDSCSVAKVGDRLVVHSSAGAFSGIAIAQGSAVLVSYRGAQYRVEKRLVRKALAAANSSGEIRAPMPGLIVDVRVQLGDPVEMGDTLLVLEAMKTQQPFLAPFSGKVSDLKVAVSDQVAEGDLLAVIEASE